MITRKTVDAVRADAAEHVSAIRTEIEQATTALTVALVVISALAAFAVVYTLACNETGR